MNVVAWVTSAIHLALGALALIVASQPALNLFRSSFREPRELWQIWLGTAVVAGVTAFVRALVARRLTARFEWSLRAPDVATLCVVTACTTLALASLAPFSCVQAAGVLPQFRWIYLAVHFALVVGLAWRAQERRQLQHQLFVLLVIGGLNGRLFSNDIAVPTLLLLSACLTFVGTARANDYGLPRSKLLWVLLALAGWTAWAALESTEPDRSWQAWLTFAFFVGLAFLLSACVRGAKDAWRVAGGVLVASTVLAAFAAAVALVAWPHATPRAIFNTRFLILNQHPNLVAPHFGIAVLIAVGFALATTSRKLRVLAFGLAGALAVAMAQAQSKASLAATVIAIAVLIALRAPRLATLARAVFQPRRIALAIVAMILVSALFAQFAPQGMKSRFSARGFAQSFGYRLDIWSATLTVIGKHPWLGVGPENYREAASHIENAMVQGEKREPHPHNLLLAVTQATGVPGALSFLALIIGFFVVSVRIVRRGVGPERDVAATLVAASVVPMVCCITDVGPALGAFLPGAWLAFLGAACGLDGATRGQRPWSPHPFGALAALPAVVWVAFVIAVRPARADAAVFEARALLRSGDAVAALSVFQRAHALDPLNRTTALTIVDLWQRQPARDAAERDRNLDAAEAMLAETTRRWPQDPGNDLLVVGLQRTRGRIAEARTQLEAAVARLPDMVTAAPHYVTLGSLAAEANDRDGAFASWRRALELDVAMINLIPWKKQRRADGFDDQFVELRARDANGAETPTGFRAEDLFAAMEADLQNAEANGAAADVPGWMRLYHLYFNAHDYADAERVLARIQALPGRSELTVARELGDLRRAQGKLDQAVTYYERGLAVADNLAFRIEASKTHRELGNFRLARDHMRAALRLKEDFVATADVHAEIYRSIGELSALENEHDAAVEAFGHALFFTSAPTDRLEILVQTAIEERKGGRPEAALRSCLRGADLLSRAAIDLVHQPLENPVRTLALETVRAATTVDRTGATLRRAIAALEQLRSRSPGLAVYEAHLELAAGDASAAYVALERARQEAPMNRIGRLATLDVLIASRRTQQIDAFLAQLREIGQQTSYEQLRESNLVRDYEAQTRAGTITWTLQRDVGDFFLLRGDFERAAEFYGHAIEGNAESPELLARMGRARLLGGKPDDARQWFERARLADPEALVFERFERGIAP